MAVGSPSSLPHTGDSGILMGVSVQAAPLRIAELETLYGWLP